ncbi:MAG: aldo/keto reductase [Gammaproteobacteria bacterium]|nr:aldo/keto reductase [Gammaproteobacteria bacterium]
MIQTRNIGATDTVVTELGFGGGPLGAVGDRITEDEASEIMRRAWDGGIRYFDTAPLYGHGLSEKRVGGVLRDLPREAFALSSKVGRLLVPQEEGERFPRHRDREPFAIRYDYSYDAIRRSMESSLNRLGLDRIDILLCHDIDVWTHGDAQPGIFDVATKGALPALRDLREQGVVRAIGLGVNEWQVCDRVLDMMDVDCFLLAGRFTLLEQEPLDAFLPKCLERHVSIIIGAPYNSGVLVTDDRRAATYDYKPVLDQVWQKAQAIRRMCESHGVDPRAAALRYPLRHAAVAAVIPGVRSLEEVETNLDLIARGIPDALWRDLAEDGLARDIAP